jgi:hypothetical protein
MQNLTQLIKQLLRDMPLFTQHASGLKLRSYQIQVAQAIINSVIHHLGLTFVIIFPRQSGKNELQAQIETYMLTLFSQTFAEIVKISPTWKPQSLNAMRRLERVLSRNLITRDHWSKESGYIYKFGSARMTFLSGSPTANIVGATANVLLEIDEAQDIQISKYDKDILPMAASTNATRALFGTSWTSHTLLAREMRAALLAEEADGIRRVFILTADNVAAEVPNYGQFVADQIAKLGRSHPLIRTQFFSEEIDAEGSMFPPARRALLNGAHTSQLNPKPGSSYAALIDVAGEEESATAKPGSTPTTRNSTTITIVEADLSTLSDKLIAAPTFHVVHRRSWTGDRHTTIFNQLCAIIDHWDIRYIVIDSTGVGTGLSSFLSHTYPQKVIPIIITSQVKSKMGWDIIALIDSGRLKDHVDNTPEKLEFVHQLEHCTHEIGLHQTIHWAVPNGTRDTSGNLVNDDWITSLALVTYLDDQDWSVTLPTHIIQRPDPLAEIDREGY